MAGGADVAGEASPMLPSHVKEVLVFGGKNPEIYIYRCKFVIATDEQGTELLLDAFSEEEI